ncbi:hypothetical protein HanIR_Chr09g0414851 [Helianthus annuus]|nr:hypothetical protein HanIR_Chr09g0414851 [Helianthus annuus]
MHLQHSDHAPVSAGHGPVVGNRSFYHFVFCARADHPGHCPVLAEHGLVLSWTRPVFAGHNPMLSWAEPHAQLSSCFCFSRCCRGVGHATFLPFLCIYVGFGCIFASFVHLNSFNPENTKERQKHTFSNIST